jgi:hypothetical protein
MTRQQFELEKIRQVREARDRELVMLAQGRLSADPRYVRNAVSFHWMRMIERKRKMYNFLRPSERRRLNTLEGLLEA